MEVKIYSLKPELNRKLSSKVLVSYGLPELNYYLAFCLSVTQQGLRFKTWKLLRTSSYHDLSSSGVNIGTPSEKQVVKMISDWKQGIC